MASTEMIQMCRQTLISTPPNNPDLPQSLSFTLSDAHQFIDMVKAIVATQIASTAPSPHCARSVKSPILQTPSPPVTALEQLLKLIQSKDSARASSGAKPDAKSGDARLKRARAKKTTEPTFYVQVWGKTSLLLSKTCTKHLLIDYIKKTYTPTTEMLVVQLLLGKDNVDTDLKNNEGHTPLWWAAQKGLLLKRKDVDPNFPDSGKFDRPELPAITWPDFGPAELPAITWPDFKPTESAIILPDFKPAESAITLPDFEPADITWNFKPQELPDITWDFKPQDIELSGVFAGEPWELEWNPTQHNLVGEFKWNSKQHDQLDEIQSDDVHGGLL